MAEVAVGLDAVADERLGGREGRLNLLQVVQQRRLAVDVQRRAVLLGQFGDGDVLAVEGAVAVVEVVHRVSAE